MSEENVVNETHYLVKEFADVEEFLRLVKLVQFDFWETKTETGFTYWLSHHGTFFVVKTPTRIEPFKHEAKQTTIREYIPFKVKCRVMTLKQVTKYINGE